MKTELLQIESDSDRKAIQRAGRLLRDGAIVALPTETGYKLAAKAEQSVLTRLAQVTGRAPEHPYTLHIGSRDGLLPYVPRPSLQARKLMQNMWPGPVTIIFEQNKETLEQTQNTLPAETFDLLYHDGTLQVRCPDNPVTSAVLDEAIAPIVAVGAHPGNQPPAVSASELQGYFDGQIELIIDAHGSVQYRTASTVKVGCGGLEILRKGPYSRQQIVQFGSVNILFVCTGNTCRSPMAEALCRKYFADKFKCGLDAIQDRGYTVGSAGIAAFDAMPASVHALAVSREKCSPLESHRSRALTEPMVRQADLIFGMTHNHVQAVIQTVPDAAAKCFLLDDSNAIADPVGYDIEVYRACAEQIERCLSERMNELL